MNCPSCGAEIDADQRYAHLAVCDYCQSAIVLDEKAARVSGKMAVLPPPVGPLYLGGTGELGGQPFRVLGRVRYGYQNGYWDEWYLAREDGQTFWISEDERNFTLEVPEQGDAEGIDFASAQPGETVTLRGQSYHIDEKDVAECEGGEGQLPFAILSGERVPFIDLSSDQHFATIEYDLDDNAARVYLGRRIKPADIRMDVPRDDVSRAAQELPIERAGDDRRRERIVRSGQRMMSIQCEHCAAPLEVPRMGRHVVECPSCGSAIDLSLRRVECPECHVTVTVRGGREAQSATCSHCSTRLDIRRSQPSALGALVSDDRPRVPVALGQQFTLRGTTYYVVGHVRYTEKEDFEVWNSDEFLLYAEQTGYRWLLYEDGHFSFGRELDERPTTIVPRTASQKQTFRFLGRQWTVFELCYANSYVTWVDGELPWVAKVGDKVSYMDAIAPPRLLSAEWTETEAEWFIAEYLDRQEVAQALGTTIDKLPPREGVAPHQPLRSTPFLRQSPVVMLAFAAVFFGLAVLAFFKSGRPIAQFSLSPGEYAQEYVTEPFQIEAAPALCELGMSAHVDNGWVYLDIALINENDEALLDFSVQSSYYHGVEGGESWSEGSKSAVRVFRIDDPGEYRLLVLGEQGDRGSHNVHLTLSRGVAIARYYLVAGVLALIWPLVLVLRIAAFEGKRWAPVTEDDDDDDD
jgi:DNA-directed RNA polymerase subunit RPC12/RpoP